MTRRTKDASRAVLVGLSVLGAASLPAVARAQACSAPSFTPRVAYTVPEMPWDLKAADFNRDGILDLVAATANVNTFSVLLGNAVGGFGAPSNVTLGMSVINAAVADFNGDGKPDVALVAFTATGSVSVLLGNGSGGFTPSATLTAGSFASDLVAADFNEDGHQDLAVGVATGTSVRFIGNGDGTFGPAVTIGPSGILSVAAGDFNRDGHADLALADRGASQVRVELGDGAGGFGAPASFAVGNSPEDVVVGDLDRNGTLDIVAVSDGSAKVVTVLLGDGAGGFAPGVSYPAGLTAGYRLALADVDGDGDIDVAVPQNGFTGVVVLPGNGDGTLGTAVVFTIPNNPFAVATGDFNRDGRVDLAVGRGSAPSDVNVFVNNTGIPCTAASFGPVARTFPTGGAAPVALALGRLDADTRPDLVVAEANSNTVAVLLASGAGAFSAATTLPAGTQPIDVALGDLNEDGRLDLLVANYGSNDVTRWLGDGAGGFGSATTVGVGLVPVKLALSDVDQDGHLDLAVANYGGNSVTILHGNGSGALGSPATIPVGVQPAFVALADLNEDGVVDLVTAHYGSNDVALRPGTGGGSFGAPTTLPLGVSVVGGSMGDFNGDGHVDFVFVSDTANAMVVVPGNGAGGFGLPASYPTGSGPQRVAVGDVNNDGKADVVVSNALGNDVSLRLGDGAGGFGPELRFAGLNAPYGLRLADVDDDGAPDLLVTAAGSNAVVVLPGTSGGLATAPTYLALANARDAAVGDLNRDGKPDVVVAGASAASAAVLAGDGAAGFGAPVLVSTGTVPSSPALGDFNGDGRLDLVLASRSMNAVSLLLGDGAGGLGAPTTFPVGDQANAVLARDFDGDGDLDVVIAKPTLGARISVLLGDGTGGLGAATDFGAGDGASMAVAADLNRDGQLDVAVSDTSVNRITVLLGNGGGTFAAGPQTAVGFAPGFLAVGDINRDGKADLVVGARSSSITSVSVLLGVGDGSFTAGATLAVARAARPLLSDVTLDGRLDLVVTEPLSGLLSVLPGDGSGGFGAARTYGLSTPLFAPLPVDLDRDGRVDLVVPTFDQGGRVAVLRNTNCRQRHLRLSPDVSSCNTPGAPFLTQPALRVVDDGDNTNQCDIGSVSAAIVPGSGSFGAVLSGTNPVTAVSGLAAFTDLSVDLPGRGYRLAFVHPLAPGATSHSFTQAPFVSIAGPATVCQTASALYDAGGGWDKYAWMLDGVRVGGDLRHLTLASLAPGGHTLEVTVQQDGCSTSDARLLTVLAELTSVAVSTPGPTTVCPTCTGGTVVVSDTGGGPTTHQWGYTTVPGGAFNAIPGATGASYVLAGADFPGPGAYYLVARSTPTCGAALGSNEIPVFVSTPPDAVQFFAVTSTSGQNLLQWINPAIGATYVTTHVRYNAIAGLSGCTFPASPSDGTGLPAPPGLSGQRDSFLHGGLPNDNTTYCYAVFVEQTGGIISVGRFAKGRPFDTGGPVKWAYSTGAAAMTPPSVGPSVYAVSNDRVLHAVARGATGGMWPPSWTPMAMNAPAQWRAPAVATNAIPGATQVVLVGSQDGSAYAVNALTGASLWTSPLGQAVQGAPSALLTASGGAFDYVFAGTRNSTGDNFFYALAAADGTPVGTPFDNGGGAAAIGVINAGSSVDIPGNRVYFASRAHPTGSSNTLWALDVGAGGVSPAWGVPVGDVDGAPTRRGTRLFVGTNAGVVLGVDAFDGTSNPWSFATGDGPVKAFVFPDRQSTRLFVSTTNSVWGLADGGAVPIWPPVALLGPSNPLFDGGSRLVVGGADGKLYQLDLTGAGPVTPPTVTSVTLGDGGAAAGSPTLDVVHNMIYVGSEAGIVYGVQLPLP